MISTLRPVQLSGRRSRARVLVGALLSVAICLAGLTISSSPAQAAERRKCLGLPTSADGNAPVTAMVGADTVVKLRNANAAGVTYKASLPNDQVAEGTLLPFGSTEFPLQVPGHVITQLPFLNGFRLTNLSKAVLLTYEVWSDMCANDETIWHYGVTTESGGASTATEPKTGTRNAQIFVEMGRPVAKKTIIRYSTADGAAKAGSDYASTSGSLTFNVGDQRKYVSIPILADSFVEGLEAPQV